MHSSTLGALGRGFFLPVLAAYPILHMATVNPGQIPLHSIAVATLVAIVVAIVLAALCRFMTASPVAAVCAAAFLVALFYSYGPVHTAIETSFLQIEQLGGAASERLADRLHLWLSTLWLIVGTTGVWALCRLWREPSARLVAALNVVAAVLLLFILVQIGMAMARPGGSHVGVQRPPAVHTHPSVLGYTPDVYYIILDGYARADVLQQYYGFDNSSFIHELEKRAFRVNSRSSANYYWTFLSLASSLNMDYLQELFGDALPADVPDRTVLYDAIRNNEVARFLQARGYSHVHIQSTWGATLFNPYADQQVSCRVGLFQQEFFRALAEASWLKALQSRAGRDLARCHLANLVSLARMGQRPGPKYVFAHFLPPHHPYLFDHTGRILRDATLSNQFEFHKRLWEKRDMYVEQLRFMNGRVIAVIDEILQASAHKPIIVIQSDHGPQLAVGLSEAEQRRVRLANFAAFLVPGAPQELLPPDISPINEFRSILSFYFGAELPVLPQRHYFSSFGRPYAFETVPHLEPTSASGSSE